MLKWIVVGAGPAGIAGVGKLLDAGISPEKIMWIDPAFKVGDFLGSWRYISSNTPVEGFTKFLHRCKSFGYSDFASSSMIDKLPPDKNCPLMLAGQPLQVVTNHLRQSVGNLIDQVTHLVPIGKTWEVHLASGKTLRTEKVLLAMGGKPKELSFPGIETMPLATAMNPSKLKKALKPEDVVVVFGSAQSAKSVLGHLKSIQVKKKILFYRSSSSFDRHLDEESLEGVQVLKISPKNLLAEMPYCTKLICAIGFERRHIPIMGLPSDYGYDQETGEIAPGVFGLGMAFPNIMLHELGLAEYRVAALWPVMKRLEKLLPQWLDLALEKEAEGRFISDLILSPEIL